MASLLDSMLKISAGVAESGLMMMGSAMKSVQSSMENLSGQGPAKRLTAPPVNGPGDLDAAVSEYANRLACIARFSSFEPELLPDVWDEIVRAARMSFRFVDFKDPKNLLLPLQLPFSVGTLMVMGALRGLASFEVVGAKRYPAFLANVFEMFTEIQFYVSVQYDEILNRYRQRLERDPNDSDARIELGSNLIKCGRHDEARTELLRAAEEPKARASALHWCSVAEFRSGRFAEAVKHSSEALALNPSNERTRIWLWQSAQKLGGYPAEVPADQRMEMKAGYEKPTVEFEDVAAQVGLDKTSAGRGVAIFDYNNDGHLDVLIAAAHAGCSLYRNNGDGTFTDVSVESGLGDCVNGFAITAGDFDNDGFTDVFVTRLGFYVGEGQLWRNNGDGAFTDVTKQSGIRVWGPGFTPSWVDYDRDGHLDLLIVHNLGGLFDRKTKNLLFHNNGDGTFTEVSDQAGLKTVWPTIGAAWGDYNNDGYPDLFLSNAMGRSQLYRNNGDGTFTDVTAQAGPDMNEFCIGSTAFWLDYDNDGWLDLLQFNWSDHEDVIHTMRFGEGPADGRPLRLYHNNRDGTFTLRSRELGITGCWGTMSGNCGDFNNDGYLDIVLGNGSPRMERVEPPVLLEFDGEKYKNITFAAGLPFTGKGHGGNMADLFGDGRLCVLVASGGAYPGDLLTTSCYRPKRLAGNYLNVRLEGTRSNRSAIGARVSIGAGGRTQHRLVSGGSNFGCLPLEQHFGIGAIDRVDWLEIWWPSGLTQRLENPPVNSTIRITEGQEEWQEVYQRQEEAVWA
ncbi:MAG: FG-GAP-like repeat-containing protein [Bryobacteraceae bacterium]